MAVDLSILLCVECAFAYRALRGDEYLTGRDNGAVLSRGCLWQPLYCFHFAILLYGFMLR